MNEHKTAEQRVNPEGTTQMGTPGPWGLRGSQIRAEGGLGKHVATYQICRSDGLLLAAAPRLLEMLIEAADLLEAWESGRTCGPAEGIRAEIEKLIGLKVEPTP